MDYMAGQYSISKIDTPLSGTVLAFSEQQDLLALAVEFSVNDVITTVLSLEDSLTEKILGETLDEQSMSAADHEVIQSVYRFFPAMKQTVQSEFLRKNIMQEVIYDVLCGSQRGYPKPSAAAEEISKFFRETDKRPPHHTGSRRLSAVCEWKNCRWDRCRRRNGGTGLRNRGTRRICI